MLDKESSVQVLGINWFPESDKFLVHISLKPLTRMVTKRVMLSEVPRVFDILGLLSSIIIRAKIMMQSLWREKLGWDDPISSALLDYFNSYRLKLSDFNNYSIDRVYSKMCNVRSWQLISLCDSSSKAYCTIVYMCCDRRIMKYPSSSCAEKPDSLQ